MASVALSQETVIADSNRHSLLNSSSSANIASTLVSARSAERFTMDAYATGLAAMLRDSSLPVPLLMGIHGKFGSGKTHLIKAVLWKIKRVCGFSCTNMGRPMKQAAVTWMYSACGCQVPFFGYLLLLSILFFLVVGGVISFMIWASVVYHVSLTVATNSTIATVHPPEPSILNNDVLYPLLAASAFMAAGLLVVLAAVIAYCCQKQSSYPHTSRWLQLKTILVMLLCETPPLPIIEKHDRVDIIPIVFNAWEYAGCDVLWAGIIKNIFDEVEEVFGKWKLRLYRTFPKHAISHQHDMSVVNLDADKNINAYFGESLTSRNEAKIDVPAIKSKSAQAAAKVILHTAKWMHVPYPILVMLGFATVTLSILVIILFAVTSNMRELVMLEQYLQLAAGLLIGLTALSQISNVWALMQTACSSQASQLDNAIKKMRGPDLGSDLGFMHTVKIEVQKITAFVKLMGRIYQKKFRVLIVIDDLDKCESSRILSILEAINILLSEEDSLFVTLVAIDHNVVSSALGEQREDSNSYLKRIIQMRFCIPEWTSSDMENVLDKSFFRRKDEPQFSVRRARQQCRESKKNRGLSDCTDTGTELENLQGLLGNGEAATDIAVKNKVRRKMTKLALQEMKKQIDILPTSFQDVRHLCNMVFFTVYLWIDKIDTRNESLESMQLKLTDTCIKLTWWVIMTEEWPYRCSWLLRHIDEMDEKALKTSRGIIQNDSPHSETSLITLYEHVKDRLKEPENWKHWIGNDSNPEHFEIALVAFPLTITLVKYFLPFTINLDRTVKQAISEHCKMRRETACDLAATLRLVAHT